MEHIKSPPGLRLKVVSGSSRIIEVKSPDGRTIGHLVNGGTGGPNLVVAGTRPGVRSVFQRVLQHPVTMSLKGCLFLLFLDQLDHGETQCALEAVAKCFTPITATLFVEVPAEDVSGLRADNSVQTILTFCEENGATVPISGSGPVICDYAS